MERAAAVRRRPLHLAGARAGRPRAVRDRAPGRDAARPLDRAEPRQPATRIGYDPWLHTVEGAEKLAKACAAAGAALVPIEPNPIERSWSDRPAPPLGPVTLHDLRFAGEAAEDKLARIRAEIAKLKADALVVSDPHAVAWTFNIRGADVAHTPLPLAFAIVPREGRPALYVDGRKLANDVRHRARGARRRARARRFRRRRWRRSARPSRPCASIRRPPPMRWRGSSPARGGKVDARPRPDRADEGGEERGRDRRRARRASCATAPRWCAFSPGSTARRRAGKLTEIDAVEALETFRRDTGVLKDVSFPTIAGAGPDGAIVHYRVTRKTNRAIAPASCS